MAIGTNRINTSEHDRATVAGEETRLCMTHLVMAYSQFKRNRTGGGVCTREGSETLTTGPENSETVLPCRRYVKVKEAGIEEACVPVCRLPSRTLWPRLRATLTQSAC